jgi:glutathione reductase (NADPH)
MDRVYDYDLFVIGGGSGGVRAARVAASHGARVAIAEEYRWGGTCVIRGCVPKKLLVYASEIRNQLHDARGFGWTIEGASVDWSALIAAKDREIGRLSAIYLDLLRQRGVAILDGRAQLADAHTVEVAGKRVTAAHILVAAGGHPRWPKVPGAELLVTSNEAFHLPALPRTVVILGGGYIAVEFAHIFAGLGSQVVVAHRRDRVLPGFDGDVRTHVEDAMKAAGIEVITESEVTAVEKVGDRLRFHLGTGVHRDADLGMAAIGREPSTPGLGLAEAGVQLDGKGAVVVDDYSQTSVPHIHAVGDITGRQALTPIAIQEGQAFADTVFGGRPTAVRHDLIPTAVFGQPPTATIGLSEEAARAAGHPIQIYKTSFRAMRHTLGGRNERTLMKLVIEGRSRRVLGLHMVGADAPEIVQAAAIAITMGATKDDFDRTIALHPTAAEELVLMRSPTS